MNEVRLETERLILRTYRLSDFEDHFKLCADPDVMRYLIGGKPMSRFEATGRSDRGGGNDNADLRDRQSQAVGLLLTGSRALPLDETSRGQRQEYCVKAG
jgi:hypothetical protein